MSSTKKRKLKPSRTATLHDFFSRTPAKTPSQQQISAHSEAIVIDSDEDISPIKKSRVALAKEDSSDVEIVDDAPPVVSKRPSLSKRTLKGKGKARDLDETHLTFGEPSVLLQSFSPPQILEASTSFGAPYNLLRSEDEVINGFFGPPTSILLSPRKAGGSSLSFGELELLTSRTSSTELNQNSGETPKTQALPEADNEWSMGDDEVAYADSVLEDDRIEELQTIVTEDVVEITDNDSILTCPVCQKQLTGCLFNDVQTHVNNCLDSLTPTPLRPISSFQVPLGNITLPKNNGSAFSVLMSSRKENEAWKEASIAEDRDFRANKNNGGRRKVPFYKVLQGMPIAVDAFKYGTIPDVNAYFLTHAHSDHYTNLASNWKSGPIYCSEGTAKLIMHMLSVDPKWVYPLPMDTPTVIPDTGGVQVILIEANHCPGSCLFLFEGLQTTNAGDSTFKSPFVGSKKTFRYLHCGDFRASPQHVLHPAVKGKRIDHVYLDTTYLDPKYTFPPQALVISACADLAKRLVSEPSSAGAANLIEAISMKGKTGWFTKQGNSESTLSKQRKDILFIVGTYSIGKERIVKAIAQALGTKVYCEARKAAILRCQSDPDLHALLTSNPLEASVHLVPLGMVTSDKLKVYVDRFKGRFTKAVGFRPTGWSYTKEAGADTMPSVAHILSRPKHPTFTHAHLHPARNSTAALQLYGVPYSEHSSFFELTCFAMSLDWGKMIATVNVGSESSRAKMAKWVERWEAERKKRGKVEVVSYGDLDYW